MNDKKTKVKILHRFDVEEEWIKNNPILGLGELALTSNKSHIKIKIGNGINKWRDLPYNETLYTNLKPTTISIGGIQKGSTFNNCTMTEMWNNILYKKDGEENAQFDSLRIGNFDKNNYIWDIGYSDKSTIGTLQINQTDTGGVFIGLKSRGTANKPLPVQNNDNLLMFRGSGYDGKTWRTKNTAGFSILADDNWSEKSNPTRLDFYVINKNSSNNFKIASARSNGIFEFFESIKIGQNENCQEDGIIRFNGKNFQGYKLGGWVDLDISVDDLTEHLTTHVTLSESSIVKIIPINNKNSVLINYIIKDVSKNNICNGQKIFIFNDEKIVEKEIYSITIGDTSDVEIKFKLTETNVEILAEIRAGSWDIKIKNEAI